MKYILILFIAATCCLCNLPKKKCTLNTDYFLKTKIAKNKFKEGNYELSFRMYSCAFNNIDKPLVNDALFMASTCFKTERKLKAKYYLEVAVLQGTDLNYIKNVAGLAEYSAEKQFIDFEEKYSELKEVHNANLNVFFLKTLDEMIYEDSIVRDKGTIKDFKVVDMKNANRLKKIIKSRGLPCYSELTNLGRQRLYALFLHFCYYEDNLDFYLPKAREILELGIIEPKLYKYLLERSDYVIKRSKGLNEVTMMNIIDEKDLLGMGIIPKQMPEENMMNFCL